MGVVSSKFDVLDFFVLIYIGSSTNSVSDFFRFDVFVGFGIVSSKLLSSSTFKGSITCFGLPRERLITSFFSSILP